jgi:hypothetical protein
VALVWLKWPQPVGGAGTVDFYTKKAPGSHIVPLRQTNYIDTLNVQEAPEMEPSQAVRPMFSWMNTATSED